MLAKLMRRYPRGQLWSFGREVTPASSEEEFSQSANKSSCVRDAREDHQTGERRRQEEGKILLRHFPGGEPFPAVSVVAILIDQRNPAAIVCPSLGCRLSPLAQWLLRLE